MATPRTALVALVLCVVGALFLSLTIRNELRARALDGRGVITVAEVTDVQLDRDTDAGARVVYGFDVAGRHYEGSNRHLARRELDVASSLRRIEIRYLPEDPTVSAPTQAATTRTQVFAFFISGAVEMAGLALVMVHVSWRRRTGRWWG